MLERGLTWRGRLAVLRPASSSRCWRPGTPGRASPRAAPGRRSAACGWAPSPARPSPATWPGCPAELPPPGAVAAGAGAVRRGAPTAPTRSAAVGGPAAATVAVFRVPLPRVQTALRFEALDPACPPPTALDDGPRAGRGRGRRRRRGAGSAGAAARRGRGGGGRARRPGLRAACSRWSCGPTGPRSRRWPPARGAGGATPRRSGRPTAELALVAAAARADRAGRPAARRRPRSAGVTRRRAAGRPGS